MIGRASVLLEALAGQGDVEAVAVVGELHAAGVTSERIARAIEALIATAPISPSLLGSPTWALAPTALLAGLAGARGLSHLANTVQDGSLAWALPLLPLPLVLVSLMSALRSAGRGRDRLDRSQVESAVAEVIACGLAAPHARTLVDFLSGGRGAGWGARGQPLLLTVGAALTVVLFWSTYCWLVVRPIVGGGIGP